MSLDTSRARTAILEGIRRRQRREHADRDAEAAQAGAYLTEPRPGPQPSRPADLAAHFVEQAERMASTVEHVAGWDAVPVAAARFLRQHGLPLSAIGWPSLATLAWPEAGMAFEARPPHAHDAVGITGVFCAVAETGSLVCFSGSETFASATLLPETHIAVVPVDRIVHTMEDVWALARAEHGALPRAVNCISGPSRTGDIEQTIVLGAHGPYRVHVLLVHPAQAGR